MAIKRNLASKNKTKKSTSPIKSTISTVISRRTEVVAPSSIQTNIKKDLSKCQIQVLKV